MSIHPESISKTVLAQRSRGATVDRWLVKFRDGLSLPPSSSCAMHTWSAVLLLW